MKRRFLKLAFSLSMFSTILSLFSCSAKVPKETNENAKHISAQSVAKSYLESAVQSAENISEHSTLHRRNNDTPPRIYLDSSFYWSICPQSDSKKDEAFGQNSTLKNAASLEYKPLEKMHLRNLYDLAGGDGKIVWLKLDFELPPELEDSDLSLVIPYLHFADELYLNGRFIGSHGSMEKSRIQDSSYAAHLFDFPKEFLIKDGINTIYIKVLALGYATVSPGVFIGLRQDAQAYARKASFWQSRIYLPFEGGMFAAFVLFLVLFLFYKKQKLYLYFSLLNFFSITFTATFFSTDLPWVNFENGIPFFIFFKISRCLSLFGIEFMSTLFILEFLKLKHHAIEVILRIICSIICIVHTIFIPTYQQLMKITPFLLAISGIDLFLAICTIIKNLFNPEKRLLSFYLLAGALPIFGTVLADIILKLFLRNTNLPYFSFIGWQQTIIFFFVYFSTEYRKLSVKLESFNTQLEKEVAVQTQKLTLANEQLNTEIKKAQQDIKTAALVQKKLFNLPETNYPKWDIAVLYQPLSIVSGDFYNFYSIGSNLYSVSLFDASGHGVSASLITMLAENIIQQNVKDANIYGEDITITLERINSNFIAAKGDIETYLTGILLNIREHKEECSISLVNAAHPCPLLYHAEEKICEELLPYVENPTFGPVGMDFPENDYAPLIFAMRKDDVLLLFTDGVTEAMNKSREEFGRKKLNDILENSAGKTAVEILDNINEKLKKHINSAPPTDDITIIIMKRK